MSRARVTPRLVFANEVVQSQMEKGNTRSDALSHLRRPGEGEHADAIDRVFSFILQGAKINAEMRSKAEAVRAEKQAELDKAKEELAAQEVLVSEAEGARAVPVLSVLKRLCPRVHIQAGF